MQAELSAYNEWGRLSKALKELLPEVAVGETSVWGTIET